MLETMFCVFMENLPEGIQEILKNATPERIEASPSTAFEMQNKSRIIDGNYAPQGEFDFKNASDLNQNREIQHYQNQGQIRTVCTF